MLQSAIMLLAVFLFLFSVFSLPLSAYVGPGAGFVFVGSFFFIFAAFFLAAFQFITLPFRIAWRWLKKLRHLRHARFRRVIIVGFDGMDFQLFNQMRKNGNALANFSRLEKGGTFLPLLSSEPPVSPVAWSTFATGVNPGKHNIFDFLTSDRQIYMPRLSGTEILPCRRFLRLGKWEIPLRSPRIELMRKSQSFWKILAKKGIYASVLRMPYTFPPEKFYGAMLSGLGTPDLRGTQGSFTCFSETTAEVSQVADGVYERLDKKGENNFCSVIRGPGHPFRKGHPPLRIPFTLKVDEGREGAWLHLGKEKIHLEVDRISPWISLSFRAGWANIRGIAQWLLVSTDPLKLYMSPIHIDPVHPAMPISHPRIFSVYLARMLGPFATLGMAEDTWAVSERVLPEEQFLRQVYQTQEEREKIFFDTLEKVREGLIVQVFETTDRVQHMFWRYLPGSQSPAAKPSCEPEIVGAIAESYKCMDDFLGRLFPKMRPNDLLLIVSDHGFGPFDRGFHLNSWLCREGYLALRDGKKESGKFFADVDWSRTRAYAIGLNGLYLNLRGREANGIVAPGQEAEDLKREMRRKLVQVVDPARKKPPIKDVFLREEIYRGPYLENAPDLVVGYAKGFRVSWESAVNIVGQELFADNIRAWSGDHCFTREQIPGVFFCNRKVKAKSPGLIDIAPTVLSCFGVPVPKFIEGRDLEIQ